MRFGVKGPATASKSLKLSRRTGVKSENRPPRINQFSVSIQREITRDLVVEASYVANRAVWLTTTGTTIGTLGMLSQISPAQFAQFGLYPYPGSGPAGYNYQWSPTCLPGNDCGGG